MEQKQLTIFFSHGVSLKTWIDLGVFERMRDTYGHYRQAFSKINFITYDTGGEMPELVAKCKYCINKSNLPPRVYRLLIPFIHRDILRKSSVYLTVQMSGSYAAVIAKILYGKPLVVHCGYSLTKHSRLGVGIISYWKARIMEKIAFYFADRIIVTSRTHFKQASRFKAVQGKIFCVPNAINTNRFRPLNTQVKKNSISCVAKFSKQKNLFALIEASGHLGLSLDLIGEGYLKSALKLYADTIGAKVNFMGNVPNELLPQYICRTEMFIFPSFYEGSPKALLEAMACGMPVLASAIDEHIEIIEHMKNGYLSGTDTQDIESGLQFLMNNPEVRKQLGVNAADYIRKRYNMAHLLEREVALVEEVVKER